MCVLYLIGEYSAFLVVIGKKDLPENDLIILSAKK